MRAHARRLELRVADKPDSQEICFVPDGDYAAFVERAGAGRWRAPARSSTTTARVLGTHDGVHRFTVGQRKGLGLSSSEPLYVLEIEPRRGAGRRRAARRARAHVAHGVAGELDHRARAGGLVARRRRRSAIATPPRRRRVRALDARARRARVRRAADRGHAGPGRRVLRRRRGGRRRLDRLTSRADSRAARSLPVSLVGSSMPTVI